jgi:hypothetical protein
MFALVESLPMVSSTATRLLETSAEYVSARFEFDRAVRTARTGGMSDEEIAHLIGFSVAMVEAVAGKRRSG